MCGISNLPENDPCGIIDFIENDNTEKTRNFIVDVFSDLLLNGTLPTSTDKFFSFLSTLLYQSSLRDLENVILNAKTTFIQNTGVSAQLEIACALSIMKEIIQRLLDGGISIETIQKKIILTFGVGCNLFSEIAKLRAARLLIQNVYLHYDNSFERQKSHIICVEKSTLYQSTKEESSNILRWSTATLSAIIGGANYIVSQQESKCSTKESPCLTRAFVNTQRILQHEAFLTQVVDPLRGSYFVEALTDRYAREAWNIFQLFEKKGGFLESFRNGTIQELIDEQSNTLQRSINNRSVILVGTNKYYYPEDVSHNSGKTETDDSDSRIEFISNHSSKDSVLLHFETLQPNTENFAPSIIENVMDAFTCGATTEEIFSRLFTEEEKQIISIKTIKPIQLAEPFEKLQEALKRLQTVLKIAIIKFGFETVSNHRTSFIQDFIGVAGITGVLLHEDRTVNGATNFILQESPQIVIVCSDDKTYKQFVPDLIGSIRHVSKQCYFYIAGFPEEGVENLRRSGISGFIHKETNVVWMIKEMLKKLDIFIEGV